MGLGPPPRVRVMGPLHFCEEPQGSRSGGHFLHKWQRRVVTCAPRASSAGAWSPTTVSQGCFRWGVASVQGARPPHPSPACFCCCVVLLVTPAGPPVVVPVGHRTLHLSCGLEGS